jgi:hypothetical protein
MHITVTWLELFFDLSVVIAVHNIAVPVEEEVPTTISVCRSQSHTVVCLQLSFPVIVSYWLRIVLMWAIWQATSFNVNISNNNRAQRRAVRASDRGASLYGADQWLGWGQVIAVVTTTALITLMSNSALVSNDNHYYAYYCLAAIVVRFILLSHCENHPTTCITVTFNRQPSIDGIKLTRISFFCMDQLQCRRVLSSSEHS